MKERKKKEEKCKMPTMGPFSTSLPNAQNFGRQLFGNATEILYCCGIPQWMCANAKHIFENGKR